MKGILLGMCYSMIGFNVMIQDLITLPFTLHSISSMNVPLTCGFWYFLLQILILLIFGLSFIVVVKCIYKKRSREDEVPNELTYICYSVLWTICKLISTVHYHLSQICKYSNYIVCKYSIYVCVFVIYIYNDSKKIKLHIDPLYHHSALSHSLLNLLQIKELVTAVL